MEKKIDPFTGEEFTPKRRNQKFANVKNKADYNNEIARQEREIRKEVDSKIIKNHRILKAILVEDNQLISKRMDLEIAGFDFHFFNHVRQYIIDGVNYQFMCVYQFMFANAHNQKGKVLIKKIQDDNVH